MMLRFFEASIDADGAQTMHKGLADSLVGVQDTRPLGDHDDAVRQLLRMENCPTTCRPPDNIDPGLSTFLNVDLVQRLMPPQGNGRWFPAVDAKGTGPVRRAERAGATLIVLHIECPVAASGMFKSPNHYSMGIARDDPPFALRDEVQKVLHLRDRFDFLSDTCNGLGDIEIGTIQQAECSVQKLDGVRSESSPPKADNVQPFADQRLVRRQDVWGHILHNAESSTDHGVVANHAELMDGRQSADDDPISKRDMPSQGNTVRKNHVVSDDAVVSHMRIRHEQRVAANRSLSAADCSPVQRNKLSHDSPVAELQDGGFSLVFQILRRTAHRGKGVNPALTTNTGSAVDDGMSPYPRPISYRCVILNNREGTYVNIFSKNGFRTDNGVGIETDWH